MAMAFVVKSPWRSDVVAEFVGMARGSKARGEASPDHWRVVKGAPLAGKALGVPK